MPNTAPSTDDINNSLPPSPQNAPSPTGAPTPATASVSLDDLQKVNPNAKRKPRAKKRKKRPSGGNKPSFLDKLGLGKKKKPRPSNLPPMANAEGNPKPMRRKKKPKPSLLDKLGLGKKKKPKPASLPPVANAEGKPTPARIKKKPKSKTSFLDKLGLGKKKKPKPSKAPNIPKTANPAVNPDAVTNTPPLDSTPTSAVEKALKAKGRPNLKGKKGKIKRGNKKNNKSVKLIAVLLFSIIGLALALWLLLPLLDDAQNGNLQGTVTSGNVENQQSTEEATEEPTEAEEETATNEEPSANAETPPANAEQAKEPQKTEETTENKPVKPVANAPKKANQQLMNSKSNNSNKKITLNEKDFLELADTPIYRDE